MNDYAKALAEVGQMQQDLVTANATIAELRRSLDQADDRVALINEERVRYREEATVFRTKLVELATQMGNIGLLTVQAQDVLDSIREMTMRETKAANGDKPPAAKQVAVDAVVTGHTDIESQIEQALGK